MRYLWACTAGKNVGRKSRTCSFSAIQKGEIINIPAVFFLFLKLI
jgi:hypothetical protein